MERGKKGEKGDRGGKGSVSNHSCHKTLKGFYETSMEHKEECILKKGSERLVECVCDHGMNVFLTHQLSCFLKLFQRQCTLQVFN